VVRAEKLSAVERVLNESSRESSSCIGGMGIVREPRGRGTSTVGSRYQRTGEDSAG
jgi:hypothetical protein